MEKALENVTLFLGTEIAHFWRNRFERVRQMLGAGQKFRRIADARDKEQLDDYLAEIRYALVFAGLGFQVEIEPLGEASPDLRVSREDHNATVEIMRFRPIYPGPPEISLSELDDTFLLGPYGNLERDIKKALCNITEKFQQVGNDESIIAIWNDDGGLEDIEVERAVLALRDDVAQQILSLPSGLLFVLYGSEWMRGHRQLYCFPLRVPSELHQANWIGELENSTVSELIQRALTQRTKGGG